MREHEIGQVHREVRREADAHRTEERQLDAARERALDRADRREWAERKFAVGGETRWQETMSEPRRHGRRRFVFDPLLDAVVEI
jgi:hypothetical protein